MATFRSTAVTNTSTNIKTTGATVRSLSITNRHSAVIYVRFYNSPVATFQDTPVYTVAVPATATLSQTSALQQVPLLGTATGLCARVVTDVAETGNTAAATLPEIVINYE